MSGVVDLRARAEQALSRRGRTTTALATLSAETLAEELEVHRVELEMQQDELAHQRTEIHASRDRYAALCDSAPVGLLMIDTYSRILDGNATAWQLLGVHWQYEHSTDLLLYLEWSDAMKLRTALSRGVATVHGGPDPTAKAAGLYCDHLALEG